MAIPSNYAPPRGFEGLAKAQAFAKRQTQNALAQQQASALAQQQQQQQGQPEGMLSQGFGPLALNIGMGILANNVQRPYTQGPPSIGAGIASGVQQHREQQQAQQAMQLEQARYESEQGYKERLEKRQIEAEGTTTERNINSWQEAVRALRTARLNGAPDEVIKDLEQTVQAWKNKLSPSSSSGQSSVLFPGVRSGGGMYAQAQQFLMLMQEKKDNNIPFTTIEERYINLAYDNLRQPRVTFDPATGRATSISPSVSQALTGLLSATSQTDTEGPATSQTDTEGPATSRVDPLTITGIETIYTQGLDEEKTRAMIKTSKGIIKNIVGYLTAGAVNNIPFIPGTGASGIEGTLKRTFGGVARQFNIPVGTEAGDVSRAFESLKLILTPVLTQQRANSISNRDMERIDKILGYLDSPLVDEAEIYQSLSEIVDFLNKMGMAFPAPGEN